jgi:hypothetical protein
MKGFWKHIAASASITAVFVVCALAVSISAVPLSVPSVEAAQGMAQGSLTTSFADNLTRVAQAASEAQGTASEAEPPGSVDGPAMQPAPATAAPAGAAQPDSEEPAAAQDPDPNPQKAAPPAPPEFNPPTNLAGAFVSAIPPYIALEWNPNNSARYLDYCLVYREVVGQPNDVTVVQSKKSTYDDYDITSGLTYRYWVTAVSKTGEESGPSNAIEVETQAIEPPAPPQGVMAAAIDPGVSLDWQPNSEANLAGYNVYYNQNGRWRKLNRDLLSENHYYYDRGVAGDTYAVSAVNAFGLESSYAVVQAQAAQPVIYQEDDPAVSLEGLWVIERYEGASGGSIIVAGTAGDRLHFAFTGRQIKLISAKYWTCGDARIYIDGQLMGTVSMYSYDPVFQSIDISVPGLKYGRHVLTVEVVGSGNPETSFNFVNVDAFEVR